MLAPLHMEVYDAITKTLIRYISAKNRNHNLKTGITHKLAWINRPTTHGMWIFDFVRYVIHGASSRPIITQYGLVLSHLLCPTTIVNYMRQLVGCKSSYVLFTLAVKLLISSWQKKWFSIVQSFLIFRLLISHNSLYFQMYIFIYKNI